MANASQATIGKGTVVSFWDTELSPVDWASLGQIRRVGPIGTEDPEVESSTLDSVIAESVPGLPNGTEIEITAPFNSVTRALYERLDAAKADIDLRLVHPAPVSVTEYVTVSPRGLQRSEITPNGLKEITMKTKMVSSRPSTTNPHA